MLLRRVIVASLVCFVLTSTVLATDKHEAQLVPLGDAAAGQLMRARSVLAAADSCVVRHDAGAYYRIDGWVSGNELYKSYLNPALTCTDPYPFTVMSINMPMILEGGTTIIVSVDVEMPDDTSFLNCPVPGELLTVSQEYELEVPSGGGFFDIWVPLDSPIVVTGPFFAGFYLGNSISNAAVVTDTIPTHCVSFNIWDLDTGYVDLTDNRFWDFPGRLILYASGIPGGGGDLDPAPQISLISPSAGDVLYGTTELWAMETSGSSSIEYVVFSYSAGGGPFAELDRDFDGSSVLRDGVSEAVAGTGFSVPWDFSLLPENTYTIRATVYDTIGRYDSDQLTVTLEPTPPVPQIIDPEWGEAFCTPLKLLISCSDENVSYVQAERKPAQADYSAGLTTMLQNSVGDANGDAGDGNYAVNGEFGDYYNAPVAAAIAARLWADRGYASVMSDSGATLTMEQFAEKLAEAFGTREYFGTHDENLLAGLRSYFETHGDKLSFSYKRNPNYAKLRELVEEQQQAVIIGIGGDPGLWLAIDGFSGWQQSDSSYRVTASVPMTGTIDELPLRNVTGGCEIYYGEAWRLVEILVAMNANSWDVERTSIGMDFQAADGWSVTWTPSGISEGDYSYIRTYTQDMTMFEGTWTTLLRYDCNSTYDPGDYDNDGSVNLADLLYLINFVAMNGPEPAGGRERADANCDNYINVADVVFFINYLYGTAGSPCH